MNKKIYFSSINSGLSNSPHKTGTWQIILTNTAGKRRIWLKKNLQTVPKFDSCIAVMIQEHVDKASSEVGPAPRYSRAMPEWPKNCQTPTVVVARWRPHSP